ncbi:MAG TPA: class I SAM-dependent DNA methyltransferase [Acidimicrobiia bacterium]|nr:class I SAM-dependent DNA methyltransferase [Acidimicrobiia bacterium]
MDVGTLEQWLWDAACEIRGPLDAPKFKDYILPLVFLRRLSDVFDDEIARLADEFGGEDKANAVADSDHSVIPSGIYVPEVARWTVVSKKTTGLGEHLTTAVRAVARENPKLQGVIDVKDFNETAAGQRVVDDPRLQRLIQILGKHRLGIDDVEPDILGRAYEYLLRKFAEGGGASAGEFYTPREVAVLMARILDPQPGMTVYDPCCGSAGLLIKCHLWLLETHGKPNNGRLRLPPEVAPLRVFGQEQNSATYAIARMNSVIHEMDAEIALGDTMHNARFTDNGKLRRFDLVTANPMWNQDFPISTYENDPFDRFGHGIPPASTADWGWVQHMLHSLDRDGRMAVVLDTGAVSRGSGSKGANRERGVRKALVEADLIESVILLPENLFYNTSAPGIVMIVNKAKRHRDEILLINASKQFEKGRPKNHLLESHVSAIAAAYDTWETEDALASVITTSEAVSNDFNLSPSRYVQVDGGEEVLPLEDAVVLLKEAEEERAAADVALGEVLDRLGLR